MKSRFLEVLLRDQVIGYLGEIDTITRFAPLNSYLDNPTRSTLSMSYGLPDDDKVVKATLSNLYNRQNYGQTGLPNFFSNLLPEGVLRQRLATQRGTSVNAEFDLIAAAGNNLPGAVRVRPSEIPAEIRVRLITTDNDNLEVTQVDDAIEGASSLSGVQEKLALSMLRGGERFSVEGSVEGDPVIAKFAPREHPEMLANELVCTQLAKLVSIRTIEPAFYPIDRLDSDALRSVANPGLQFFASPRFDRSEAGRIHVEDWCQIASKRPGEKYEMKDAFPLAASALLQSATDGPAELEELFRRIVANALMGNCDAHLKNFMCMYGDARHPTLSPAYDLVCVTPYAIEGKYAANLALDALQRNYRLKDYVELADRIGYNTRLAEKAVRSTVTDALKHWPTRLAQTDVPANVRVTIGERLQTLALIQDVNQAPKRMLHARRR